MTNMVLPASPLGPTISLAPTQIKVNMTLLERYNGDTDPQTYLAKYNSMFIGANNATMCHLFPLTLSEQAHKWFTSLLSHSINYFEQLNFYYNGLSRW